MKATLRLKTGKEYPIEVEEPFPTLINCWSSALGIRGGKDRIVFAVNISVVPVTYLQEEPARCTPVTPK